MNVEGKRVLEERQVLEKKQPKETEYLTCEKQWIYILLMMAAGGMGAYTYILRGGVFCNAQTANFVMMAVELGQGNWMKGFYFLIPVFAYFVGAVLSEMLPNPVKRFGLFRWDTYLIGFEVLVLLAIGFLPLSLPDQIVQVSINFIASMQYNTFRQAEGIPMATTFCTNHLRQIGIGLAQYLHKKDERKLERGGKHLEMLGSFVAGGVVVSLLCNLVEERAIWFSMGIMAFVFCVLAHADLAYEHDKLKEKPHGH
ncbi:MAG: DUF1275 domain-containing protein [Firmicutes bacterium]|nr:DUF1275 domain-containing protein [Bacillota bacterium]